MNKYSQSYEVFYPAFLEMVSKAFFNALLSGRLSSDSRADNYVGDYVYTGEGFDGEDTFEHMDTRKCLESDTNAQDTQISAGGVVDGDMIWTSEGKIRLHGVDGRGRFY